jgi:TolB-like protein
VADAIITELVKLNRFEVVERTQLEKVVAEQRLSLADLGDSAKAAEAAKILGADLIVTGSITEAASSQTGRGYVVFKKKKLTGRVVLDARLINIRTTKAVWGSTTEGQEELTSKDILAFRGSSVAGVEFLLGKAVRKATNKLVEELVPLLDQVAGGASAEGFAVQATAVIRGDKLYIGVGSKAGVVKGDGFQLVALGEPFKIGDKTIREEIEVGTVEIDQVQAEYATAMPPPGIIGQSLEGLKARRITDGGAPQASPAQSAAQPPSPMVPAATGAVDHIVFTSRESSNLRAAPNATAALVASLPRKSRMRVLGVEGGWLQVTTDAGQQGWILATLTTSQVK